MRHAKATKSFVRRTACVALSVACGWLLLAERAATSTPRAFADEFTRQQELPTLAPGQTIERAWEGGQPHLYRVYMQAGEYVNLRLQILAGKFYFSVTLLTPDGKRIEGTQENNEVEGQNSPAQSAIAQFTGDYLVEVRAGMSVRSNPDNSALPACYALTLTALRLPTEQDKDRVGAWLSFTEAQRNHGLDTSESLAKAKILYLKARELFHRTGESRTERRVLEMLADIHNSLGEYEQAAEVSNQSIALSRSLGDLNGESNALMCLGEAYIHLNDYAQALEAFQRALPLWQTQGKGATWGVGWTFHSMATCYHLLGERRKAVEYGEAAFKAYQAVDYNQHEHNRGSAGSVTNLGRAYLALGEIQKAIDALNLGLEYWRKAAEVWGEARVYYYFGDLYFTLGDLPAATENYQQALAKWRISNDPNDIGNVLRSLGRVYLKSADYAAAARCLNEALELGRKYKQRRGEAEALALFGQLYSATAEKPQALEHYQQALALWREIGARSGEAATLTGLGEVHQALGDNQTARDCLQQALQLHRAVQAPEGEAQTLFLLARTERSLGLLPEARRDIETALSLIESLRASVISQNLRASYLASVRDYYEFYLDLLLQPAHNPARREADTRLALHLSERASARSLLESLGEIRANLTQGGDAALLARERELQQLLNGKSEYQVRLLSGKHSAEQAAALAAEIKSVLSQLQETQTRIRAVSPRYAVLTQPQPLTAEQIQHELLDENTLLLEYALGEEHSYLFAVTPRAVTSYELPKRAEIEAQAARVYSLLTARNREVKGETPRQTQQRATRAEAELPAQAAALSQMILGPVAAQLGGQRLLIVAQGKLQFIPFSALPDPASHASATPEPLLVKHEIVYLPSASTLAVLRREMAGRQPAPKTLALLADPVFETDDPRFKQQLGQQLGQKLGRTAGSSRLQTPPDGVSPAHSRALLRAAEVFNETGASLQFHRLANTGWEADHIAPLVPAARALKATGFAANRVQAVSGALADYRIVHFASHSFLHSAHPELSGLVLSLLDAQGRTQDGFLRLHDIYNLRLNADLVVLSACQTALGKEVKGEGLLSLARGFMYAGAPRVVVSAWKIEDRASATLMVKFYKHLLGAPRLSPAAALRAAQLEMWRDREFAAPYFWAGFVLQGEWK
ncbi:MAG: CHAT domain-containing protein [Acidobacteria bacterium]|nr:CHAT domain-containing protein [Acidobacteriota bacterium]MBI3426851.1 CHAT domain-containing protein [Acidobacteriota bacterium]